MEYKIVLQKASKIIHGVFYGDKAHTESVVEQSDDNEEEKGEVKHENFVQNSKISDGSFREISIRYMAGTI